MMDKITEEQTIIHQHIAARLQNIAQNPNRKEVVRLPLQVCLFCKQIFKRQTEVQRFLLHFFVKEFYIADVGKFLSESESKQPPTPPSSYREMLMTNKDSVSHRMTQVTVYVAQLFLRFCMLGLSVRVGEKREEVAHKIKRTVRELQVELTISGEASFADLIIAELQALSEEFAGLEFYEGLRSIFDRCEAFSVVEWVEKAMSERRAKFEQQLKTPVEFKVNETQRKIIKPKRVTISAVNFSEAKDKENVTVSTQPVTPATQREERLPSVSQIASRMRQSTGNPSKSQLKLPHKFLHRSSRKFSSQEETAQEDIPFEEPQHHTSQETQQKSFCRQELPLASWSPQKEVKAMVMAESRVLCGQTPPRSSRKRIQ